MSAADVQSPSPGRPASGGRSSLIRLPDEQPSSPPRPLEGALHQQLRRPSQSSSNGGAGGGSLMRLPDEVFALSSSYLDQAGSPGGSRPSSRTSIRWQSDPENKSPSSGSGSSRNVGLSRLPDEAPIQAIATSSVGVSPSSSPPLSSRCPSQSDSVAGTAEKKTKGIRDRLKKHGLSVQTESLQKEDPTRKAVFRELSNGERIHEYYKFAEEIYSGGAKGKVVLATRISDGLEVVVKIRTKRSHKGSERSWRAIMGQLYGLQGQGKDHVLDIHEIIEDELAFYVIMPKCNGGELFEFLVTETEVPEDECKRIIREILVAVGTLHESGLVHRDVKPENIMFDQDLQLKTPKTVKLIDFDTCVEWTPTSPKTHRFVGTPGYIAPEALLGEITPKSDLWSVGVILYILMTGETPWTSMVSLEDGTVGSPGAKRMYQSLKEEQFEWDREPWPDFPKARDLCQQLIAFDMKDRPDSVQEVLDHAWFR
eukprot:TRINITY_DN90041_c0_g1_i1.p1 TRINITY_DN90041_c0_g1~~TRINITY_DN90041_c0_g1_i1.p1  ORF type:complete len:482 (-),score=88.23 TRINITY_DN90041_c0_g1_i1:57-1502(-)